MKKLELVGKKPGQPYTTIDVRGVQIGGDNFVVMAGPCAVEEKNVMAQIAENVVKAGGKVLRGGAFKPRTNPYSFQGYGEPGLKLLKEISNIFNIPIVSEVVDVRDIDLIAHYVDILQIGARNMQNFPLLIEAGKTNKPVLLKKGMTATIFDVLHAAEYILLEGNNSVMICERGIRTFETYTRNTLDLSAVAALKTLTHLPVIVDPSHSTGRTELVGPMMKAALAVGADGIIVEVHSNPENALCDGDQSLSLNDFDSTMQELKKMAKVLEKKL